MAGEPRDVFGAAAEDFASWAERADQTAAADPGEARLLLELMRDYLDLDVPGELTPGDLRTLLLDVYPRKVTVLRREDAADTVPTARALVRFLAETGAVQSAAALQGELDELEPGFPDAVIDPGRWGMARAFTQAMAEDGVNFGDQDAVADWITRHNTRQAGLAEDEDPFGDDDDDEDGYFTDDYVDFKEAFGLPDRLPALRLPPIAELARAARGSVLLATARELAVWAGAGRKLTGDGELSPADAAAAARLLGIDIPAGPAGTGDIPALRQLWHLARCVWFLDDDSGTRAEPGDALGEWPDGDDEEVLGVWSEAFAHLVGHSLGVNDQDGAFAELSLGGVAGGLVMALFLAGDEGMPRGECRDLVREMATAELGGAPARKTWAAWTRAHGDMADVLLDRLAGHGAAELDGDVARLTPLGMWQMRAELADITEIPLLPPVGEMTAADLVEFGISASEAGLERERQAWLATRPAADAARELLLVAAGGSAAERMIAASLATSAGTAAEPAWREVLDHPALGAYARLGLNQIAGHDPAADPLPGLQVGPDDLVALLADAVAAASDEASGEELAATLGQVVPPGQEEQVIELMWRSAHPAAGPALEALGRRHPDKKIAKAARKAAFKARSRSGPA